MNIRKIPLIAGVLALGLAHAAFALPPIVTPDAQVPTTAGSYDDGTGHAQADSAAHPHPVTCISGCSGSGGGAAGGTAQAAAPTLTEGQTAVPPSVNLLGDTRTIAKQSGSWTVGLNGTLPAFGSTPAFTISGTLPAFASTPAFSLSGTLPAFASTPAFSISGTLPAFASTPAFSISGTLPAFASTPAVAPTSSGANGSTAPANSSQMGGKTSAGTLAAYATDARGGFEPAQATYSSTLISTTASASTQALAASGGRLGLAVTVETVLSANFYICLNAQTCSATVHDAVIPSGATVGTLYTAPFGTATAVTYFTTQASASMNFTSLVAP